MSSPAPCVALILSGLLSSVVACESTTAVELPPTAVSLAPPARFALWWRMTEACSGVQGDLASVSWYVVPNTTTLDLDGERVHGYWVRGANRIVLADAHRYDGPLVRHEMLHALLRVPGHPRATFLSACDGIVACDGACETEAGGRPPPPASAPELLPRDLGTRVEVIPSMPAVSIDDGAVVVTVTITNPRNEPVWVRLTPQGPGDPLSHTFGVLIDYDDPVKIGTSGYTWIASQRFPLGARERRRYIVFDGDLFAGRYGVRGYFNVDTAPRIALQVGP
jgi:hypothetical protein